MQALVNKIYLDHKDSISEGDKASYIPALANIPDNLGLAVRDHSSIYTAGDTTFRFTFQSMSKIILLLVALEDNSTDYIFNHVGMESSGDSFNSISKLDFTNIIKPYNPFINAGAILIASLIKGSNYMEKLKKITTLCKKIFERDDIGFNEEIFLSERNSAYRNRALAYLLKEKDILKGDVEEILDLYFKCCSIEVSCIDLANLGYFLSFSKQSLIQVNHLRIVKALMLTCGMYDYSGEFAVKIGLPSKSGVSGGIVTCVPQRMGIGVFSPRLDSKGNSTLGIKCIEELNVALDLNIFR